MPSDTSNLGKWDRWYATLDHEPRPYAPTKTYQLGADWLADCPTVEDWGCGGGWLRNFIATDRYRGIDGSASPFADDIADLADYRSTTPGLFMRHVLEHNPDWELVLDNALASFTQRMALILFTPLVPVTRDLEWEDPPGVPNLAFAERDITSRIDAAGGRWEASTMASPSKYGTETIFYIL